MAFTRVENLGEIESVAKALEGNTSTENSSAGSSLGPILALHGTVPRVPPPPPPPPGPRRPWGEITLRDVIDGARDIFKAIEGDKKRRKIMEERRRADWIEYARNNTPNWDVLVQTGRLGSEALQILARTASGSGLKTVAGVAADYHFQRANLDQKDRDRGELIQSEREALKGTPYDSTIYNQVIRGVPKQEAGEKEALKPNDPQQTTVSEEAARADNIADPALSAGVDAAKAGVSKDEVAELGAMAGASEAEVQAVQAGIVAPSPRHPALAYCQGTPLRNEIESRDPEALTRITDLATDALATRFGIGKITGKIRGHVISAKC